MCSIVQKCFLLNLTENNVFHIIKQKSDYLISKISVKYRIRLKCIGFIFQKALVIILYF